MYYVFEVLEQLEAKVQSAVDGISLLKMELDELRAKPAVEKKTSICEMNIRHGTKRSRSLLGKMDQMNSEENKKAKTKPAFSIILNHSISSGSGERMMPVVSASMIFWQECHTHQITGSSLSPISSSSAPTGMDASAPIRRSASASTSRTEP